MPNIGFPMSYGNAYNSYCHHRNQSRKGDDRAWRIVSALDAIFYVLCTGCQWNALPRSLGASSTVHDRFQEWQEQGVFQRFWQAGLVEYAQEVGIDWKWNAMDGAMVMRPIGGKKQPEPILLTEPSHRTKRSLLVDGNGIPSHLT